jgi:hypothetical protein
MPRGKSIRRKPGPKVDEKTLTKGHRRKLNALRKSLGHEIAVKAFAEWYEKFGASKKAATQDKNVSLIADALQPLVKHGKLHIRRGAYYVLKRGRRRVIIEPRTKSEKGYAVARSSLAASERGCTQR